MSSNDMVRHILDIEALESQILRIREWCAGYRSAMVLQGSQTIAVRSKSLNIAHRANCIDLQTNVL